MSSIGLQRVLARLTDLFVRQPVRDDDMVDRLHHSASLILLLLFAAGTAVQEYAGQPINCWTPASFPQDHYTQHINGYCWTHPLRYPASSHEVGVSGAVAQEQLNQRRLVNFGTAFYRWVTLIFVLQAAMFKLPNVVWNYLNRQSGASLTKLRDLLTEAQQNREGRNRGMDEAAQYLHAWLAAYRTPSPRKVLGRNLEKLACLWQGCRRRSGQYLSMVYLSCKALYLLNVAGNVVLLSAFLDAQFWRYGFTVLSEVLVRGDWHDPINFPRLLLCDFRLHQAEESTNWNNSEPGSGQPKEDSKVHTVQCVLSINMVLEKLFVLQWFWLLVLTILTIATFVTWSLHTVCACAPYLFARKYMKWKIYGARKAEEGERFVRSYLRQDGMFVVRMVQANTDSMVVKELVQHLWDNFRVRDVALNAELTEQIEMMMMTENEKKEEEEEESDDHEDKNAEGKKENVCEV